MKRLFLILAVFACMAATVAAGAPTVPESIQKSFTDLSLEDTETLLRGEPLIRSIRSPARMGLAAKGSAAYEVRERIASLKPNYLTELMLVIDAGSESGVSAHLDRLVAALADVERYVKIPYWSRKNQTTYDLFDRMTILSRTPRRGGEQIEVLQHMEPFDDFKARYEYRREGGELRFSSSSAETIVYSYMKFSAVAPGNMLWELYAFRDGANLVVYGIGAVKAFDMMGLFRDRLEPSFMGRIEAFFLHVARRMQP